MVAPDHWKFVKFIASLVAVSGSLLMAADYDEVFMTRSLNVMQNITEQHLIERNDKAEL